MFKNQCSIKYISNPDKVLRRRTKETFTSDFSSNHVNNILPNKTSCKYYPVNDFHILKKQKNLNIFHANVNGLGSKLDRARAIGVLYKLRPYINPRMLKNIYYSLIYSHMIYAIQVWGSAGKTEIHKILVLQKHAIRLISNKDKRPLAATNPMFYKLELLKINYIFTLIAKFIHVLIWILLKSSMIGSN